MKILLVCPAIDAANASTNLCRAINKYTEHEARIVVGVLSYYDPIDIYNGNFNKDEFMNLVEEADIIHFNVFDHTYNSMWGNVNWNDYMSRKPFIFHSHGGFGGNWEDWKLSPKWWTKYDKMGYKKILCCSAAEEKYIYKNGLYVRNIIHLEDYKVEERDWSILKVVQTPSAPEYKNTYQFKYECEEYLKSGLNFKFCVYTSLKHNKCIEFRGNYHLLYENSWCGYHGYAGLEAMSQGLASMVYQEDIVEKRLLEVTGSDKNPFIKLPYKLKELNVIKPLGSLGIELPIKAFSDDLAFAKEYCLWCREWMEEYWRPEDVVKDYIKVYEDAL